MMIIIIPGWFFRALVYGRAIFESSLGSSKWKSCATYHGHVLSADTSRPSFVEFGRRQNITKQKRLEDEVTGRLSLEWQQLWHLSLGCVRLSQSHCARWSHCSAMCQTRCTTVRRRLKITLFLPGCEVADGRHLCFISFSTAGDGPTEKLVLEYSPS